MSNTKQIADDSYLDYPAGRWKPEKGQRYSSIHRNGISDNHIWVNHPADLERAYNSNVFHPDDERIHLVIEKQEIEARLWDDAWQYKFSNWIGLDFMLNFFFDRSSDCNEFKKKNRVDLDRLDEIRDLIQIRKGRKG